MAIEGKGLRGTVSLIALYVTLHGLAAQAQDGAAPAAAGQQGSAATPAAIEGIVVTGSRVSRSGFTAPTPVTVVGSERLQAFGDNNVAQALNRLPSFRPQNSPANQGFTQANLGSQILDLRGLGAQRTLVLLDGRRVVPSTTQGTFDVNLIPSALIGRTEVVTGGASAAYGSDAVAGVVNLILDTKLKGLRASAQYGFSGEGDDHEVQLSLAAGSDLFDGRGHITIGGEYVKNNGVGDCFSRKWCSADGLSNYNVTTNSGGPGAGGMPATVIGLVHNATMIPAGLITNTALRGTQFNANGTVSGTPFVFGQNASPVALFMIGGDGANYFHRGLLISPPVQRYSVMEHFDYDFSNSLQGFIETSYGHVKVRANSAIAFDTGSDVIQRTNAFLPAGLGTQMDTLGISSFNLGRVTTEEPAAVTTARRSTFRIATGLKGKLGGRWSWDAYYQYGETTNDQVSANNKITANYARAIDSVRNGAGQAVCRSTLTDPTNGCSPFNPFGVGNVSPAALAYVFGTGISTFHYNEHVGAANLRGEPFSTWAGPVSLAAGAEYRDDRVNGTADAISAASGFFTNNAAPINGHIAVLEGYAETVVPLARDLPFARTLDLNGAVRQTHYRRSNSANPTSTVDATTWKLGAVWEPIDMFRVRVTRSRDIRAPNMVELFSNKVGSFTFINDSVTHQAYNVTTFTGGNNALAPEKGDTWTIGGVLHPPMAWLGGSDLRLSVDYYNINLKGAIAQLGGQIIVNRCIAGNADYCQFVTRDPSSNLLTSISNVNLNLNRMKVRGIDFDADYALDLSALSLPGKFELRALATRMLDLTTVDSSGVVTNRAGQNGAPASQLSGLPDWTVDITATLHEGPATFIIQTHSITSGKYDVTLVGPQDPGYSVTLANSISSNRVVGATYVNIAASYDINRVFEIFGSIDNLFDKSPPIAPSSVGSYNPVLYDPIGRIFHIGARMKL